MLVVSGGRGAWGSSVWDVSFGLRKLNPLFWGAGLEPKIPPPELGADGFCPNIEPPEV